ncbi:hypothetical protein D7241_18805 [Stutzerimonas sp. VN223-3]|uniref:hypothetical protein n=1 Tax=Stutzerimonas sp. VN223-3 TaxID=3384601 RepID=UPI0038B61F3F
MAVVIASTVVRISTTREAHIRSIGNINKTCHRAIRVSCHRSITTGTVDLTGNAGTMTAAERLISYRARTTAGVRGSIVLIVGITMIGISGGRRWFVTAAITGCISIATSITEAIVIKIGSVILSET